MTKAKKLKGGISVEYAPGRKKRMNTAMERTERMWAARSGEVRSHQATAEERERYGIDR